MIKNINFVGGIHGVGKGFICDQLSKRFNCIHLSASGILKWEEISSKKNKRVKSIVSTQESLISGLSEIVDKNNTYFLDGHLCLFDINGNIQKIPETTIYKINPRLVIIITCDITTILKRLNERDKQVYEFEKLNEMQNIELEYGMEIAKKLKVPFCNIISDDDSSFKDFIDNYENIN